MKYISIFYLLMCLAYQVEADVDKTEEPVWTVVHMPDKSPVYAMYGSIFDTLIVNLGERIYLTTDTGVTWTRIFDSTVYSATEFIRSNDTLILITNFVDYYSINNGFSWSAFTQKYPHENARLPITYFGDSTYKIVFDHTYPKQPDSIYFKNKSTTNWINIFPYFTYFYSFNTDKYGNFYIGTNNWEWDEINRNWKTESTNNSAIYFIKPENSQGIQPNAKIIKTLFTKNQKLISISNGMIKILFQDDLSGCHFQIHNAKGKCLWTSRIDSNKLIPLVSVPHGEIYFVTITKNNNQIIQERFFAK